MRDALPPQNLEAERSVLGSLLIDNDCGPEILAILQAEDFYRDSHQVLFAEIAGELTAGRRVDAVTLKDHLGRLGLLGKVGGPDAIADCLKAVPHALNGPYYAEIVRAKAVLRRHITAADDVLQHCYHNPFGLTAEEVAAEAQRLMFAAAPDSLGDGDVATAHAAGVEALAMLQARRLGTARGLRTGFPNLDDKLGGGLQPGNLVMIAARPSMGKSALAVGIVQHAALNLGKSVLMFSIEMPRREVGERILAWRMDQVRNPFREGLRGDDAIRIGGALAELESERFTICDRPTINLATIAALARQHKARHGLDLVLVDYVGIVAARPRKGRSRQDEVAELCHGLRALARDLDVPLVAVSQLNRLPEGREGHRPRLSDLRESGEWEQDAHVVLLLHRPDYYDANDSPNTAELTVAKNRNGPTGVVNLAFHKSAMRFLDHGQYPHPNPADEPLEPAAAF